MRSFGILRTNVGLTTNVKIIIDTNYNLSLDSIDSTYELSSDRFKKFKFNENNFYDELIPSFYNGVPTDVAFNIKYNNDVDMMSSNFGNQYDEMYNYGARNIIENKNYDEEYEYFAPLYINPISLPSNFIVFRVDGTGANTTITRNNYKDQILNNFKTVKLFDLGTEEKVGQWLYKNYTSNSNFPYTPLDIDYKRLEFSKWNGIDYTTGGYTSKSKFLDSILEEEKEIFELEKLIFNGYKDNKVVFPNILNLSFLFNDEPSTPSDKRKWSLNRYYGFYLNDMELIKTMSPYVTPTLYDDVEILDNNILFSTSSPDNPFLKNWTEDEPFYVEYNGEYYLVKKFIEKTLTEITNVDYPDYINEEYQNINYNKYKIISDYDLIGLQDELNQNYGFITEDDVLMSDSTTLFEIDDFEEADVWLIKIDDIYHNIIKNDENELKVVTDYSFSFNNNTYEYTIAGETTDVSFIVDYNNEPKKFNIYRLKFTDIKDFDTKIVDTEYSKYEYEKTDTLTDTDESKMYFENLLTKTEPKELDDFEYGNKVVNIPVSSEYTANHEIFKVIDDDLSDIWRVNPIYCRWGFQNSLSGNDYPYLLNNSLIFEEYNRTVDPFEANPIRSQRNLDYFYTVNSSSNSYSHHTLHVEKNENGIIDTSFVFDIDKYLNLTYDYDYFTYFFERNMQFDNAKKNVRKYSYFNKGDISIPNITLFRGLEFKLYGVDSVKLKPSGQLENINVSTVNEFEDYNFSIILTDNSDPCEFTTLNAITECTNTGEDAWTQAHDNFVSYIEGIGCTISGCTYSESWTIDVYIDEELEYNGDVFYIGTGDPGTQAIMNSAIDGLETLGLTTSQTEYGLIIRQIADGTIPAPLIDSELRIDVCLEFTYDCECTKPGTYSTCITSCEDVFTMQENIIEIVPSDWRFITNWGIRLPFNLYDLVLFDDIIYLCISPTTETKPYYKINDINVRSAPYTGISISGSNSWGFFNNSIFFNPDNTYSNNDIIYNANRYYYCSNEVSETGFWNPRKAVNTGYAELEIVLYKAKYYKSLINENYYTPGSNVNKTKLREFEKIGDDKYTNWEPISEPVDSKWKSIPIWEPSKSYDMGQLIYHLDIVYISTDNNVEVGDEPGVSISWEMVYSLIPEIALSLPTNNNSIIKMNSILYVI